MIAGVNVTWSQLARAAFVGVVLGLVIARIYG
jgi:hypothetical protein